ncbi:type I glutamate--ammonia ligase [Candidatus Gottesmanbacteria bacterium]|nr:type I glutamate--ammonia ligase [Candidatus Gottesmanbacteria bacterium]
MVDEKKFKALVTRIKKHKIEFVSLKFNDLFGRWIHFTIPVSRFTPDLFREGIAYDGSSIAGFQSIEKSDMLLKPDIDTAFVDPVIEHPTLSVICNTVEPYTGEPYWRDPRHVALKTETYLKKQGIDAAYFGPEIEFFLFDDVRYKTGDNFGHWNIDVAEANWHSDQGDVNLGRSVRKQEGYFVVPPFDHTIDLRLDMVKTLEKAGIAVERDTHERATAGSAEIDIHFDSLLRMADKINLFKYIVRNVAVKHGKSATFMPKPMFSHNGNGMHTHHSLWSKGKPMFADGKGSYHGLSQFALHYLAGVLTHASSILAFAAPTVNSYRRLVPGYEAPTTIAFGARNRSTAIRIPAYPDTASSRRIEFRAPDPSGNPYLWFSAMVLAGFDGVKKKLDPTKLGFGPFEKSGYEMSAEEIAKVRFTPGSLSDVLAALDHDRQYLLGSGIFIDKLIDLWISEKKKEIAKTNLYPTPIDFELYYDA